MELQLLQQEAKLALSLVTQAILAIQAT